MIEYFSVENFQSYSKASTLFNTSLSDELLASSVNSEGFVRLLVGVMLNCGVGIVDSTYKSLKSTFVFHATSVTVNLIK
jgi:hypothetical protein